MERPEFTVCYDTINTELEKRRYRWNLKARLDYDYDDVKQLILIHINEKWQQYDPTRPLINWLNRIITNQINNLLRNTYYAHVKPCARCPAALPYDGCSIFVEQCSKCSFFAQWEKNRKQKFNTNLPVTIENHLNELYNTPNDSLDLEKIAEDFHERMCKILKGNELTVYKALFLENKSEEEVGKLLGLSAREKDRKNTRYKRVQQIRKAIIVKVKIVLAKEGI
jgi:RNA polymerase sigma factor (sigma-70 family)